MEQMLQNEPTELSVQAVPQKAVEQACFHALTLISRNCEYLDQHLARTGADQESRQAVTDISAASAQLDRTVNEVMTLLEYLRAEELPRLYPMDLCDLLQQIAAQADMIQEQLKVELTLDYGGWTTCHVLAERSDAELLLLHLLSNALRACSEGGKVQIVLRRSESFWQLTLLDNGCGLRVEKAPECGTQAVVTIPLSSDRSVGQTVELHADSGFTQMQKRYQLRTMLVKELRTMPERGDPDDL